MATITIRDLDEELKQQLEIRAAEHSRPIEDEARHILSAALVGPAGAPCKLSSCIHERFRSVGGVELRVPEREALRDPPDMEG